MQETESIDEYILQHIDPESDYLKSLYRDTHVKLLRPRMASGHLHVAAAGIHHQHVQRRGRLVPHPLDEVHVDGAVLSLGLHRCAPHLHRPLLGDGREAPHYDAKVTSAEIHLGSVQR